MSNQFHLDLQPTNRGFLHAAFKDRNRIACSIQESSIATEECIWLGCDEGEHHHVTGDCMARMHLTREMAAEIGRALTRFALRGTLAEPTPDEQIANLQRALAESAEMDSEEIKTLRAQLDAAKRVVKAAELVYAIRDQVYQDPNSVHRALILLGFDLKRLAYTTNEQSSSQITQ